MPSSEKESKSQQRPTAAGPVRQPEEEQHALLPDARPVRDLAAGAGSPLPDAAAAQRHASNLSRASGGRAAQVSPAVLRLQRQYGNRHVQRVMDILREEELPVQRDTAREPPGRTAEATTLTEEQVNSAIAYNRARYTSRSIRLMQDIVGAPATGVMDANTVHMIVEWQADYRLDEDGKIGLRTLRTIAREMISERSRNAVINLIIDGHNLSRNALTWIRYDPALTNANARTSGPIPGDSTVQVGPPAFAQGYEGLVHTIAHELEHVRQRRAGIQRQPVREFLAEALEIMSVGMLWEGLSGVFDDARRLIHYWVNEMTADERRTHWARFVQVRNRLQSRFDRASAARRATHQATMNLYNAQTQPAAGP
jgi:hypothetical protein